jgi:hypothetical protein
VFSAKAFFGIGDFLPDTLADRAIPIRLECRMREEELLDRDDADDKGAFQQRLPSVVI